MDKLGSNRPITRRRLLRAAGAGTAGSALMAVSSVGAKHGGDGKESGKQMEFGQQTYVDTDRAGGEPTVTMHPDGTLLYSAHAGTTHFYAPEAADQDTSAFVENYEGQAYYWWSDDLGETWNFAERTLPPDGVPGSGFSDPEFAIDKAGNVYISEINLVNVAVSKSYDSGRTYELQNFFGQVMEDRQWMAADEANVLYMTGNVFAGGTFPNEPAGNTGHHLWKSTDGGETFVDAGENPGGDGDIRVDKETGILYEAAIDDGILSMGVFPDARGTERPERTLYEVAGGVDLGSGFPACDLDPEGNLYLTWSEGGDGDRSAGVYYSYSTDEGETWAEPMRIDGSSHTDIWPWIAVGDKGRAAITWLRASRELPGHDPETPGDHVWRVVAASTLNGLGGATFTRSVATPTPVHQGTICNSGTVCQAQGVDRRLGDFFTLDIDNTGHVWIGYPDTRQEGAVCLPGFVRQEGGPRLRKSSGQ